MKQIRNILACLDLTYIDPALIGYSGFFANIASIEKAYFLHVIQEYNLPGKGGHDLPGTEEIYSRIYNSMKEMVDAHFGENPPVGIETRVAKEDASAAVIDFISETGIDLVLIARKTGEYRENRYGHNIASGADCDIMIVPEKPVHRISRILCAIDGSSDADNAFEYALDLSEKTGAVLVSYFLYDTTQTYFPATTLSSASMHENRMHKQYARFLKRFDRSPDDIACHFREVGTSDSQAHTVYETALDEDADLIVAGAAGDIATPTTLLGNIATNFNNMEIQKPLLIMKNEQTKRFFQL